MQLHRGQYYFEGAPSNYSWAAAPILNHYPDYYKLDSCLSPIAGPDRGSSIRRELAVRIVLTPPTSVGGRLDSTYEGSPEPPLRDFLPPLPRRNSRRELRRGRGGEMRKLKQTSPTTLVGRT